MSKNPVFLVVLLCFLTPSLAHSATVDGAPDLNNGNGLFVWRTNNGQWTARLLSTDQSQKFSGTFEADGSYDSFSKYSIENHDQVTRSGGVIEMSMSTWSGGQDGVNFSIPNGGELCLRQTGSNGANIYLGRNAVAATPPVDLTSSGACSGSAAPAPATGRRFNAGHYVRLMKYSDKASAMDKADRPGVVGVMKMIPWRELEPSRGSYNFSEIASDLQYLAGKGLQLVVVIQDKSFKSQEPLPAYLTNYQYRRPNRGGGYTAVRWSSFVINRLNALTTALGNRFNGNSNFEGIGFQESAPSLDDVHLNQTGYTPEKYRNALIDTLRHAGDAMPDARVFWFMNFIPRKLAYMGDVLDAVKSHGIVAGGPDILPDDYALQTHTYPILRSHIGDLPMFGQVEGNVYSHPHADPSYPTVYWTMPELFRYGRDNLKNNYIFWVLYPNADYPNSYDFYDAAPVIANNPTFNTTPTFD